jgi:hypothetical protein
MERVTFVVERTGERIPCLLNPEFLEVRRVAGLVRRRAASGSIIGNPRTDDPLVATGGGTTEYELKLLFDVDLFATSAVTGAVAPVAAPAAVAASPAEGTAAPSAALQGTAEDGAAASPGDPASPGPPQPPDGARPPLVPPPTPRPSVDVRTLTQPLWALAENGVPVAGNLAPQRVRFVWGRSWNVPGVIVAIAERLECFDAQGVPKRSWLSLRMRRVEEEQEAASAPLPPTSPQFELNPAHSTLDPSTEETVVVPVDEEGVALTTPHMVSVDQYHDPHYAWAIAEHSGWDDLLENLDGLVLRCPPLAALTGTA